MKNNPAPKTIQKFYSLTPLHIEIIEKFIQRKGMISASDVVRQAIIFFHDKTFPPYVPGNQETAAGELKRSKIEAQEDFNAMSDSDYAQDILHALVVKNEAGEDYVLFHTLGNSLETHKLAGIKDIVSKDPLMLKTHLEILKEKSVEQQITPYIKNLLYNQFKINLPAFSESAIIAE